MSEDIYLEHDTTEEALAAQLPEFMPKNPESGNYKFFSTIAERLDALDEDINSIDRATTAQHADTLEQLKYIAQLIDLKPYQNEEKEHFRARVLAEFQIVTSNGTVSDLLNATATILGITVEDIGYTEDYTTEAGSARLELPGSKLQQFSLTNGEFAEFAAELIPASYRLDILQRGTFTFISPADYTANNHDPNLGYDGLDTNGNPKNNGGTYAGVL